MKFVDTPLRFIDSNYRGTPEIWKDFFTDFIENYEKFKKHDDDIGNWKADLSTLKAYYLEVYKNTNHQETKQLIQQTEQKIKITLPQSYKDFVLAGGDMISNIFIEKSMFASNYLPCRLNGICLLSEDENLFETLEYNHDTNNQLYEETVFNMDSLREEYYIYYNFIDDFNKNKKNIFDSAFNQLKDVGVGLFGTLPEHRELLKYAIVPTLSYTPILLPYERTSDNEYEAWLFQDSDFLKFKSFAEMYVFDLLAWNFDFLGIEGMSNIINNTLTKMFPR